MDGTERWKRPQAKCQVGNWRRSRCERAPPSRDPDRYRPCREQCNERTVYANPKQHHKRGEGRELTNVPHPFLCCV